MKPSDLSHINNLTDLKSEIVQLKLKLRKTEQEIMERVSMVPRETVKAGLSTVLPSFLTRRLSKGVLDVAFIAGGLLLGKTFTAKQNYKATLVKTAKKLGVYAVLRGALKFWTARKQKTAS